MKKLLIASIIVLMATTAFAGPPAFIFQTDPALLLPKACTNGQMATYTAATNRWNCAAASGGGDVVGANAAHTWGDGTGPQVWTFSVTGTDATMTVTAGAFTLNTALALGANNLTMTGSLGATGAGKLTKVWAVDAEFTNYPTVNGNVVFNQAVTSTSNPAFSTANLTGANSLALGTSRTNNGSIIISSGTALNDYLFTITASNFGSNLTWTLPTAAPGGANYLLNVDADGTMGYTDPASLGGGAVATDTIWDAEGDLVVGTGANTAGRLAKGAQGTVPQVGAATIGYTTYALPTSDCTEGQILKANASGDFVCGADDNSGSATALNSIGDATGDGTIDQTGYKQIWTSTLNSAGSVWTFTNTTADLSADVSFIDFKYTDDGDANGFFLRGYDNAGNDLKWSIGANGDASFGAITATSVTTSASASPTILLNDSDALGADKEIGKIVGAYIDGADGAENGTVSIYAHEAGTTTEYIQADGKNVTIDLLKPVVTTAGVSVGTSIELGHASDTTIARDSAGVVSIETVPIVTTTATQTLTNKTLTAPLATLARVDGHAALSPITAAQVSGTVIRNTGQALADVNHTLPQAAAGYNFIAYVGTTLAATNYWRFTADASPQDYMCLDGTCGKTYVSVDTPTMGDTLTCYTEQMSGTGLKNEADLGIGTSANTSVKNTVAVEFDIAGTGYSKAIAETAPGNDTVPQNLYGAVGFEIGADGTIDAIEATDNATGYASAALAVAGIPAVAASHTRLGTVSAMSTEAGGFVFGTTALNAANTTVAYVDATVYTPSFGWVCITGKGTWSTD